jgi:hypothetical protein
MAVKKNKNKIVVKEIVISLFGSNIVVVWGGKPAEIAVLLKTKYPVIPDDVLAELEDDMGCDGCFINNRKSANGIIWLCQDPNTPYGLELLSHEATHAAYRLMNYWSIPIEENTQEVLAMLVGHIVHKTLLV